MNGGPASPLEDVPGEQRLRFFEGTGSLEIFDLKLELFDLPEHLQARGAL